ncbi:DUF3466 family protein [Vibrio sp. TH_r3]|uniref:DUF3466 family protein n=1 Tax=Vibrio sp. TH_r3 TaxID=3082084 RepID=UPI0029553ECD|nr:DUF3466 family protein [Vibrio sp. TH_r3]MDV7104367.1 DUF3466 family protein [Vibrio sp. TH_r3]
MSSNKFKLTALALLVLGSTQANAALYRVVPVSSDGTEAYGTAIESGDVGSDELGCFSSSEDCNDGSDFTLAGDSFESYVGFSYKQEVPFGIDNRFFYLDQNDLENYCEDELGYATCDAWAENQWFGDVDNQVGGLYREREAWDLGTYKSNASGFIDSTSVGAPDSSVTPTSFSAINDSKNVVITALDDDSKAIGITSSGYFSNGTNAAIVYRQRGFYDDTLLLPKQDASAAIVAKMGRTLSFDWFEYGGAKYVVGSAAIAPFNYSDSDKDYSGDLANCLVDDPELLEECQNFAFAMKPYVWDVTDPEGGMSVASWQHDSPNDANVGDYSAQGSVRAAVVPDSGDYKDEPVLVGFNTDEYNDVLLMQAAVFYPKSNFSVQENGWSNTFITNATVRIGGEYIHSNSVAKDINNNLLVIGEAKRYGNKPELGSANNRLFIADASNGSPSANFFSGGIFFTGSGGEANAINNYNEIVGQIDAETHREVNGKARRKRAFIYPYSGTGSVTERRAIFNNQAWWIDDLTNGGEYSSSNNQYRIINASDINDAGVISATALKCSVGEYDSTAHNAYCGEGSADEEIIAVKLVPISGAISDDIEERKLESSTISRQGGSIGFLALTLLALFSFRRYR